MESKLKLGSTSLTKLGLSEIKMLRSNVTLTLALTIKFSAVCSISVYWISARGSVIGSAISNRNKSQCYS